MAGKGAEHLYRLLNKVKTFWQLLPPQHKKFAAAGVAGYAIIVTITAAWIWSQSADIIADWHARIPSASVHVKTVFSTPQLTEAEINADAFLPPDAMPGEGLKGGRISLIMTEMGLSKDPTTRALRDLPDSVTLAISPYSPNFQDWLRQSTESKNEALLLLPMEPVSYPKDDPGPKALMTNMNDQENAIRLKSLMENSKGVIGVANFMGSRFMSNERKIIPVLDEIRKNKLIFVETPSASVTPVYAVAQSITLPYIAVDLEIDASATEVDIRTQLLKLESIAREKGFAVGMASPYPLTFNILKTWMAGLDSRGIELVPLTTILDVKAQYDKQKQ